MLTQYDVDHSVTVVCKKMGLMQDWRMAHACWERDAVNRHPERNRAAAYVRVRVHTGPELSCCKCATSALISATITKG